MGVHNIPVDLLAQIQRQADSLRSVKVINPVPDGGYETKPPQIEQRDDEQR